MKTPLVIAFADEFGITIEEAVQRAIEKALPAALREATRKEFLTKGELMELTGWSARQVEYKKSRRELPFIRRGRTVLFPTEEVYAYLNEGLVPAKRAASAA